MYERSQSVDSVYGSAYSVYMTATEALPTRDRLVVTARGYLESEGVEGIGLREIARRAGLSHGAPLRHFSTLGSLLAAVAAEGFRDLIASVEAAVADADGPLARVRAAATGYVRFAEAHPGVFALMFRADLCDTDDPHYALAGGFAFGQLVELLADAQAVGYHPEVPAPELAGVLWAAMHGLASLHLLGALVPTTGQTDLDVLIDHVTHLLVPDKE